MIKQPGVISPAVWLYDAGDYTLTLELMMTTEGEERDRAECVYIQLLHGLEKCSDE